MQALLDSGADFYPGDRTKALCKGLVETDVEHSMTYLIPIEW